MTDEGKEEVKLMTKSMKATFLGAIDCEKTLSGVHFGTVVIASMIE